MAVQGEKLGTAVLVLTTDAEGLDSGLRDAERKAQTSADKMRAIGSKMQSLGKQMTAAVTAPIIALATVTTRTAAAYEDSMSKIIGLVGVESDQVAEWSSQLLDIAKEVGKKPQELADAMFFITSAGLRGSRALDALKSSAKASTAGLGDLTSVADAVTSAMNAYGPSVLDAQRATDTLVATVREGKMPAEDLATSIGQVLPLASAMGVQFNEVGAMMASLSRTGTDAATAATEISAALSALLSPSDGASKALSAMGLSAEDLRKQVREKGLLSALQTLMEATNGDAAALSEVIPNIRAMRGLLGLLGENAESTAAIMEAMADNTGDTDKAFGAAADTLGFRLNAALSSMQASLVQIGDVVGPRVAALLERAASTVGKLVDWFDNLNPSMQQFLVTFAAVAAVAGPGLVFLGSIAKAAPAITAAVSAVSGAFSGLATAIGGLVAGGGGAAVAGLIGGPFGLAIAGFAALSGKAADLAHDIAYWIMDDAVPKLKQFAADVAQWFVGLATSIADSISRIVASISGWVTDKLDSFKRTISGWVDSVKGFFGGLADKLVGHSIIPDMVVAIGRWMDRLGRLMVEKSKAAAAAVLSAFQSIMESPVLDKLWSAISGSGTFQGFMDKTSAMLSPAIEQVAGALVAALTPLVPLIEQLAVTVAPVLVGVFSQLGLLIQNTMPFWEALVSVVAQIAETIGKILTPIFAVLGSLLTSLTPLIELIGEILEQTAPFWEIVGRAVMLLGGVLSWLIQKVVALGTAIWYIFTNQWGKLKTIDWGTSLRQTIDDVFSSVSAYAAVAGQAMVNNIVALTGSFSGAAGRNVPSVSGSNGQPKGRPAGYGTTVTGYAVGSAASYSQPRPITVNIDVHDNRMAGSGTFRDLALELRREFVSLGVMGM